MIEFDTTLTADNMIVEIVGNTAPDYVFSWRIVKDPMVDLVPNRPLYKFSIILFNIETSLSGDENVKISFVDYSQI